MLVLLRQVAAAAAAAPTGHTEVERIERATDQLQQQQHQLADHL
jgi:hypothetical protein